MTTKRDTGDDKKEMKLGKKRTLNPPKNTIEPKAQTIYIHDNGTQ
jgi:hypothetical protein